MSTSDDPAHFYTGLVAELYEPLVGDPTRADDYVAFLEASGGPTLELACGGGTPMLDLIERGYEVDGVDSSPDMIAKCRRRAAEREIEVTLYEQEMQRLDVPKRYRSIFLAGASFTLLPSDDAAARTLRAMHDHLLPGGSVLIPLTQVGPGPARQKMPGGPPREARGESGEQLSVQALDVEIDREARTITTVLRYERRAPGGEPESVEREWQTRWWSQPHFRSLLEEAGFSRITAVDPAGGRAAEDAPTFVFLAQRGD